MRIPNKPQSNYTLLELHIDKLNITHYSEKKKKKIVMKFINKLITKAVYTREKCHWPPSRIPRLYVGVELSDAISSKAH